jgi:hypothetical protein
MTTVRLASLAFLASTLAQQAEAATTDVVFKGGGTFTSATNCPDWNPAKNFFSGTYWTPVATTTNGPDTIITFHQDMSVEGFELKSGSFNTTYKPVKAYHIYTRVGNYNASIKLSSQTPAVITKTTQGVNLTGSIKGFGFQTTCIANFNMNLVRDLQP